MKRDNQHPLERYTKNLKLNQERERYLLYLFSVLWCVLFSVCFSWPAAVSSWYGIRIIYVAWIFIIADKWLIKRTVLSNNESISKSVVCTVFVRFHLVCVQACVWFIVRQVVNKQCAFFSFSLSLSLCIVFISFKFRCSTWMNQIN